MSAFTFLFSTMVAMAWSSVHAKLLDAGRSKDQALTPHANPYGASRTQPHHSTEHALASIVADGPHAGFDIPGVRAAVKGKGTKTADKDSGLGHDEGVRRAHPRHTVDPSELVRTQVSPQGKLHVDTTYGNGELQVPWKLKSVEHSEATQSTLHGSGSIMNSSGTTDRVEARVDLHSFADLSKPHSHHMALAIVTILVGLSLLVYAVLNTRLRRHFFPSREEQETNTHTHRGSASVPRWNSGGYSNLGETASGKDAEGTGPNLRSSSKTQELASRRGSKCSKGSKASGQSGQSQASTSTRARHNMPIEPASTATSATSTSSSATRTKYHVAAAPPSQRTAPAQDPPRTPSKRDQQAWSAVAMHTTGSLGNAAMAKSARSRCHVSPSSKSKGTDDEDTDEEKNDAGDEDEEKNDGDEKASDTKSWPLSRRLARSGSRGGSHSGSRSSSRRRCVAEGGSAGA